MGLQFEVESLEGLEDGVKSLYKEHNGKYRLEVEGIDPADELKNALQKERENSKSANQRLKELEALADENAKKALKEQGNYKELSEKYQKEKLEAQKALDEMLNRVATKERDVMVRDFASSLTSDPTEQKIISKFALDYIQIEGDQVSFSKDIEEIKTEMSMFIRNKASGTNDNGNNRSSGDSKTVSREQFDSMNHKQRADFAKSGGKVIE